MGRTQASTILGLLKDAAKPGTKKVYANHGHTNPEGGILGVQYSVIYEVVKKAKAQGWDSACEELWESGYLEARLVACMLLGEDDSELLDTMVNDAHADGSSQLASAVAESLSQAGGDDWTETAEEWMGSEDEFVMAAGYSAISVGLRNKHEVSEKLLMQLLKSIPKEIDDAPNRAKYAMNNCVVAIGAYNEGKVREAAIKAAKALGVVEVDHGKTSCKTPVASEALAKAIAHSKGTKANEKRKPAPKPKAKKPKPKPKPKAKAKKAKPVPKATKKDAPKAKGKQAKKK